jgi:hypothetical protein
LRITTLIIALHRHPYGTGQITLLSTTKQLSILINITINYITQYIIYTLHKIFTPQMECSANKSNNDKYFQANIFQMN